MRSTRLPRRPTPPPDTQGIVRSVRGVVDWWARRVAIGRVGVWRRIVGRGWRVYDRRRRDIGGGEQRTHAEAEERSAHNRTRSDTTITIAITIVVTVPAAPICASGTDRCRRESDSRREEGENEQFACHGTPEEKRSDASLSRWVGFGAYLRRVLRHRGCPCIGNFTLTSDPGKPIKLAIVRDVSASSSLLRAAVAADVMREMRGGESEQHHAPIHLAFGHAA